MRSKDATTNWPDDDEFRHGWLTKPIYVRSRADRSAMILRAIEESMHTSKNELLKIPGVQSVSFAYDAPVSESIWVTDFYFNNETKEPDFTAYLKFGDEDYLKTFGMQLAAGHFYQGGQSREVVVNENMVKRLGMKTPEEALGKTIRIGDEGPWLPIGGVVRDPTLHDEVCAAIESWWSGLPGWRVLGIEPSPILGPEGNREFLIAAEKCDA
jgi:hypothetical protein